MSDSPERVEDSRAKDGALSRESQLRAARLRAVATLVGTLIVGGGIYFFLRSQDQAPPGACTTSSQCTGLNGECLHAPTGAYCTHACVRNEDCDPGMHCDVPPWEKERDARALCIHDTKPAAN